MTTLRTGASVGLATSSLSTLSPNYFNSTSYIWLWQGNCPSIAIRELRHSTLGEKFTLMFSNGRSTMADIWPKNVPNIEILSCSFHTSNIWLTGCSEVWQAIYCLLTVTSHVITDNTTPENYTFKTILFFYIPDLNIVSLIVKGNWIKKNSSWLLLVITEYSTHILNRRSRPEHPIKTFFSHSELYRELLQN